MTEYIYVDFPTCLVRNGFNYSKSVPDFSYRIEINVGWIAIDWNF